MSVLVYIESENGSFKKAALEVASYGRAMANALNSSLSAVVFNADDMSSLSNYGVDKVLSVKMTEDYNAETYADVLKIRLFQKLKFQQKSKLSDYPITLLE